MSNQNSGKKKKETNFIDGLSGREDYEVNKEHYDNLNPKENSNEQEEIIEILWEEIRSLWEELDKLTMVVKAMSDELKKYLNENGKKR